MDYQVFLVSRMHEVHSHGAAPLAAVRTGFRQAAPVVMAAAALMFTVVAGFVPSGEATIESIAFALAVGILVEAFVVRTVLVPAALTLLGERARWPLRWLPVLDVEGEGLRSTPASDHGPVVTRSPSTTPACSCSRDLEQDRRRHGVPAGRRRRGGQHLAAPGAPRPCAATSCPTRTADWGREGLDPGTRHVLQAGDADDPARTVERSGRGRVCRED